MTPSQPKLWLIAGPNGAGKTTVTQTLPYATLLQSLRSLNPDNLTKELLRNRGNYSFSTAPSDLLRSTFIEAAESIFSEARLALKAGEAICLETVLSTDKYRQLVDIVLEAQGIFGLLYVAVASPEISRRRISARVRQGGHDVPTDKLADRWKRSLEQLPWFIARATHAAIYDNSNENPDVPPTLIARKRQGVVEILEPNLIPELTQALQQSSS